MRYQVARNIGTSVVLLVIVELSCQSANGRPEVPATPEGASTGHAGVSYSYRSAAGDPDADSVALRFSWGDGDSSFWSGYVPAGRAESSSHSYTAAATYAVQAQARDCH